MSVTPSFASIYVETIRDLIAAKPRTIRAVDEFTTELVDDVVDPLEPRMQELLDAYNSLANERDALAEATESEADAAGELKEYERQLRSLIRAERRRERDRAERAAQREAEGLPADEDEEHEEDEADALEQDADDRSQEYLGGSAIPEARGKLAAATRAREEAVAAVQESLEFLLQALLAFEER